MEHPAGSPAPVSPLIPPPYIYDLITVATSQSFLFPGFFALLTLEMKLHRKKNTKPSFDLVNI